MARQFNANLPKMTSYKTVAELRKALRRYAAELGIEAFDLDDEILSAAADSPLAESYLFGGLRVGNRWTIHPMEGWDGKEDGKPTELTVQRWLKKFAASGAKLIWGCEATAVTPEGRANPHQLYFTEANFRILGDLLSCMRAEHARLFGGADDFVVGLQLTHSGRFCRPNDKKKLEPRVVHRHPALDKLFGVDDDKMQLTAAEVDHLIKRFGEAAKMAQEVGFDFVDVKACHGYLSHEFLAAKTRNDDYGGTFEYRTNFLKRCVCRIKECAPGLPIAVRFSAWDGPHIWRPDLREMPSYDPALYHFGVDSNWNVDLTEPIALIKLCQQLGVCAMNVSVGSPYYNPWIQRPAFFAPSDGKIPERDPLYEVLRQIYYAKLMQQAVPDMPLVGTGYSYLHKFLPLAAQWLVRNGWIRSVGIGRMVLAYPDLPAHTLSEGTMPGKKKLCVGFSDCTTASRNGLRSICFPLDPDAENHPDKPAMEEILRR